MLQYEGNHHRCLGGSYSKLIPMVINFYCLIWPYWLISPFTNTSFPSLYLFTAHTPFICYQLVFLLFICSQLILFSLVDLQILFLLSLISYEKLQLDDYVYPGWAELVGWLVTSLSISCIPLYILYNFWMSTGSFWQVSVVSPFQG